MCGGVKNTAGASSNEASALRRACRDLDGLNVDDAVRAKAGEDDFLAASRKGRKFEPVRGVCPTKRLVDDEVFSSHQRGAVAQMVVGCSQYSHHCRVEADGRRSQAVCEVSS